MSGNIGTPQSKSKKIGSNRASAVAWCRYNGGSGDGYIQDTFNVSSLTDGGNGIHTVNFIVPMSHTTYCVVACTSQFSTLIGTTSTGGALIETRNNGNSSVDTDKCSMAVFQSMHRQNEG